MTEKVTQELDQINPQRKWNWRKTKKKIKKRAASLFVGSYAFGCRGHPGIVIERNYWPDWQLRDLMGADVSIKSLIDGVEESCSIFSCAPMAISKEEAEFRAEEIRTINSWDLSVKYSGYPLEKLKGWLKDWIKDGTLYYVLHDQEGQVVRSPQAFNKEDAEEQIQHLQSDWIKERGVTNPRIVEMLTYPAPIKSFNVEDL